ncbi:MAG: CD1871A family CXXC motif-containing protein [Lachnospiraceae bacterium]|jgi:hypothetical protein
MGYWKKNRKIPLWILGCAAGLAFLGVGAVCGQLTEIWQKAVMICLECIGIG